MTRIPLLLLALLLTACSHHPSVPEGCASVNALPALYPDYAGVTLPSNIAPPDFMALDPTVSEVVARITAADGSVQTYGEGRKVIIPADEWTRLRDASRGQALTVECFMRGEDGGWSAYSPFVIHVALEPMDRYVSYRLIDPSYELYSRMSLCQRDVTGFDETEIFNNRLTDGEGQGQCVNCHSYQDYQTDNMLFHVRGRHGATVMVVDGEARLLDLKRPNTISAGVYPAWHPTERRVAFSTDVTHQWFHTRDVNKIEVFDTASDLILYDIDRDSVSLIAADTSRLEVFPTWSPDGRWLYYCAADAWRRDSTEQRDFRTQYESLRYNLYRRAYHDGQFGPEQPVYLADTLGRSCSLPRLSPDGRHLAFAEGRYGYFNIWHHEADIRVLRIEDRASQGADIAMGSVASDSAAIYRLIDSSPLNSPAFAESYPSWSSDGHWLMMASRRDDGNYSRIYLAYFDGEQFGKPFLLPQRDPEHNLQRMQSYNRPEFMTQPVSADLKTRVARLLNQR